MVILGIVGFVCGSMLLNISQNIAFVKATSDTSPHLALTQIENLLQSAITESLSHNGTAPLASPAHSLHFARVDEGALQGAALHNAPFSPTAPSSKPTQMKDSTLMPHKSLEIIASHDRHLDFGSLQGWEVGDWLAIISQPQAQSPNPNQLSFKPYRVVSRSANSLTLDSPAPPNPLLALPITLHSLHLRDEVLWLDHFPLLHKVASFEVSLISSPHAPALLKLTLCQKRAKSPLCAQGMVILESRAQILP